MNIVSRFQLPCSNGLWVMMFWRSGGKGLPTDLMNHGGVCRTAPTTPGLLNRPRKRNTYLLCTFKLMFNGRWLCLGCGHVFVLSYTKSIVKNHYQYFRHQPGDYCLDGLALWGHPTVFVFCPYFTRPWGFCDPVTVGAQHLTSLNLKHPKDPNTSMFNWWSFLIG